MACRLLQLTGLSQNRSGAQVMPAWWPGGQLRVQPKCPSPSTAEGSGQLATCSCPRGPWHVERGGWDREPWPVWPGQLGGCLAILGLCLLQRPGPQLGVVLLFWRRLEVLGRDPSDVSSLTRTDLTLLSRDLCQ